MRKCGTCSACCRWPSVKEINKPPRTPCQHLHKQGFRCQIYDTRPQECMKYQCTWLRGAGWEKDRPNKSKVLIDRRMTKWGFVLVAKPLEPFARMTREAQGAMIRAARDHDMLCLVTDWENTELVIGACGDAKHVEPFQQRTKGKPVPLGRASDFTKIENLIEQVEAG